MEEIIINYLKCNNVYKDYYLKINDNSTLTIIYNLLINKKDAQQDKVIMKNPLLCYYYGLYHQINNNNKAMRKYYKKSIEYQITEAMVALGWSYNLIKPEKTKRYFLMAIESGNKPAMHSMALYYQERKDYESMIKYYLMAIDHGYVKSMNSLGQYYKENGNYDQMMKYYLMTFEHGSKKSMFELGLYYQQQHDYQQMEIYYLMAIKQGHIDSLYELVDSYCQLGRIDEMINYNLMAIEKYNNKYSFKKLLVYYEDNLDELLNQIIVYKEINKRKEKYSQLIIKNLAINVTHFRFRDESLGMKIINYHFQLNQGVSEENIYQQLKDKDYPLLDYLTIVNKSQVREKINEYLGIYVN